METLKQKLKEEKKKRKEIAAEVEKLKVEMKLNTALQHKKESLLLELLEEVARMNDILDFAYNCQ